MAELKPCPFCGHKAEIRCTANGVQSGEINGFYRQYKIECCYCGATNNHVCCVSFDYSPNGGLRVDESKLIKEIANWNRRAEDGK